MATGNLLITLRPSSGVDLGRWVLQHHKVPYTERAHAPIFHVLALKWWGVGAEDYPLYVTPKGDKLKGNPFIIEFVENDMAPEDRLIPDAATEPELHKEVTDFTTWIYDKVSGDVVTYSYFHLLKYKWVVWPSLTTRVPWYEKVAWFLFYSLFKGLMYKGLNLDKAAADTALQGIYAVFDKVDGLLADGRQYLSGGRLTYSDISVAALYGPMILAQGYEGFLPNQAGCPAFLTQVYQELRDRPTGHFIQRIYDRHRPPQPQS
ncbi:MAG: glutathione S-transferase family protein [Rhodobacter sp.]|nr:glutathione S-transferase family protein [Rhodobacter sp.]